jgi:cytochrome c oxidase assembly factor CtaG
LALDYYGVMFVYLLSPWFRIATEHPTVHELGHLYFFACGLVFWHSLIGTTTRRRRRSPWSILTTVALGAPVMAALGVAVALRGPAIAPGLSGTDVTDGAVALAVGGVIATGIGLAIAAAELKRRRARGPLVTRRPGRLDVTSASAVQPGLTHAPSS